MKRPGGRSARIAKAVTQAAQDVLSETGMAGFSVGEVSARAGVHPTTIYRRWKTPESLMAEAALASARQSIPIPHSGTLEGDLRDLFTALAGYLETPLGRAFLQIGITATGPDAAALRTEFWAIRLEAAGEIVTRAVARGEIAAPANPLAVMEDAIAPLYFQLLVLGRPASPALIARCVVAAQAFLNA